MAAATVTPRGAFANPEKLRLPRSSSRLNAPRVFCRLVTGFRKQNDHVWIDGPVFAPGSEVSFDQLGCGLLLECAGPIGAGRGHRRPEVLWILWRWNGDWRELGRVEAIGSEWIHVLGPIVERELAPNRGQLFEISRRGADLADQSLAEIEQKLVGEPEPLRKEVWRNLYDQLPGRIVA
jgi:hypothetical protein